MHEDRIDLIIEQLVAETRCSKCGGRLSLVKVLTKQTLVALIETRCVRCSAVAKTICFDRDALRSLRGGVDPLNWSGPPMTAPGGTVYPPRPGPAPITVVDVVRIAKFLEDFDGDFIRLFSGEERS